MEIFEIAHKKEFMAKLLKSDLFDTFQVREIILHTSFKSILDGKTNTDFYDTDEQEHLPEYLNWQHMRPYVYQLIAGSKQPSYMKIVFATTPEKTAQISEIASTFFLNITYKDHEMSCSTGIAYKTFTLDKSDEKTWDDRMKRFLLKYDFI
ncbi:MAG: DUF5721 family protein [Cellulosilyticaceae bacterium]